jgi:hypothetical protein
MQLLDMGDRTMKRVLADCALALIILALIYSVLALFREAA